MLTNEFFPAAFSLLVLLGAMLFGFLSELRMNHRFRAFRPYPNETYRKSTAGAVAQPSTRLARYARW